MPKDVSPARLVVARKKASAQAELANERHGGRGVIEESVRSRLAHVPVNDFRSDISARARTALQNHNLDFGRALLDGPCGRQASNATACDDNALLVVRQWQRGEHHNPRTAATIVGALP